MITDQSQHVSLLRRVDRLRRWVEARCNCDDRTCASCVEIDSIWVPAPVSAVDTGERARNHTARSEQGVAPSRVHALDSTGAALCLVEFRVREACHKWEAINCARCERALRRRAAHAAQAARGPRDG